MNATPPPAPTVQEQIHEKIDFTDSPSGYSKVVLFALSGLSHVYGGTVGHDVIARRRARNKAARISRRINRRSS